MRSLMKAINGLIEQISSEKEDEIRILFSQNMHQDLIKYLVEKARIVIMHEGQMIHSKNLLHLETKQEGRTLLISFDILTPLGDKQTSIIKSNICKGDKVEFVYKEKVIGKFELI